MDRVHVQPAPAGLSLSGAFWFHVAAAIGLLPAMMGLDRRARRPVLAVQPKPRLLGPARGRGNLVEAAMLAIAAAEAHEAAARESRRERPPSP